jgi:hypothetical protein
MPEDDNGLTFSLDVCRRCKIGCCQDAKPPLTEERKKIIKEYLEKQNIKIEKPFVKKGYSYPAVDELVFCGFFNKLTGKCSVHPVKPETCRAGPVTFDINFSTEKVEWFLKNPEICAFAGLLYSNKAGFKEHFEVAKKELIRLISQLDADELRAIVKIEEPQTFKIGEDDLPLEVIRKLGLK